MSKNAEQDDKKTLILNSAEYIFQSKDYHQATVEEIAKKAGVGKGTIYQYFSSKQDILQELYQKGKDEYIKRQENIKKRIKSNVVLRDDNENNENPNDLIKEYIDVNNELSDLIVKITNKEHETKLEIGISIADAINIRDKLERELDIYKTVLKELNSKDYRNAKNEIKMKVLVNVKEIQAEADKLSKAYSDIDVIIQSANWNTDL